MYTHSRNANSDGYVLSYVRIMFTDVKERQTVSELGLTSHQHIRHTETGSGPEVIKLFSYSAQLSMEFFLLINVKMPTIVGILTVMSGKNSILGLSEPKKTRHS